LAAGCFKSNYQNCHQRTIVVLLTAEY